MDGVNRDIRVEWGTGRREALGQPRLRPEPSSKSDELSEDEWPSSPLRQEVRPEPLGRPRPELGECAEERFRERHGGGFCRDHGSGADMEWT